MFPKTVTESLSESMIKQASYLSAEERSELLIMYCENAGEIWMLQGEQGFIMMETDTDLSLPVWPHKDFAVNWQNEHGVVAQPQVVDIDTFVSTWAPGLEANNTTIVAFPFAGKDENMILPASTLADSWSEAEKND